MGYGNSNILSRLRMRGKQNNEIVNSPSSSIISCGLSPGVFQSWTVETRHYQRIQKSILSFTHYPETTIAMLEVYLDPCTVNSRKVLAGLDLLGTEYHLNNVNYFTGEHKKPEYLKINPMGTVSLSLPRGKLMF